MKWHRPNTLLRSLTFFQGFFFLIAQSHSFSNPNQSQMDMSNQILCAWKLKRRLSIFNGAIKNVQLLKFHTTKTICQLLLFRQYRRRPLLMSSTSTPCTSFTPLGD
nr:hypothetical transcript [Hymenolepis microstoma]